MCTLRCKIFLRDPAVSKDGTHQLTWPGLCGSFTHTSSLPHLSLYREGAGCRTCTGASFQRQQPKNQGPWDFLDWVSVFKHGSLLLYSSASWALTVTVKAVSPVRSDFSQKAPGDPRGGKESWKSRPVWMSPKQNSWQCLITFTA